MKKLFISLSLLLTGCSSLTHAATPTADTLALALTSVHTLVFGKDNLLLDRIPAEESNKWFDMIKEVRAFVAKNVPSSSLNKDMDTLWQASADLLNTLKELYGSQFSKRPLSFDKNIVEKRLASLREKQQGIKKILAKLKKAPFFEKAEHKDAREIISKLSLFLDVTYDKVFIDWKKIIK